MDILLNIDQVSKQYAAHRALTDVSIQVPRQSVFGLLGPNGAGKTSLIRIINQITAPDSGRVLLNGEPLAPHHVTQIGYLPEERGLYKKMEVAEQVMYFARLRGLSAAEARKRMRYWFEKFDLDQWKKKKIEELSKGMAQKVQFIITVLHEPSLLILDEPFSGFDPINAELIRTELLNLRDKGTTIILSTHRMETVESLCDHIALINRSKKILEGEVKAIRRQYRTNLYEVAYTGTLPQLPAGILLQEQLPDDDDMKKASFRLDGAGTNQLLTALMAQCEIHHFSEVTPSVHDIFIQLVKGSNHE